MNEEKTKTVRKTNVMVKKQVIGDTFGALPTGEFFMTGGLLFKKINVVCDPDEELIQYNAVLISDDAGPDATLNFKDDAQVQFVSSLSIEVAV